MTELKAILLDMDDTLIDWSEFSGDWVSVESPRVTRVYDYLCKNHQLKIDWETYKSTYFNRTYIAWRDARTTLIAPHLGQVLVQVAEHFGVKNAADLMDLMLDIYDWGTLDGTTVFPEIHEMLDRFRRAGLKLGLVTNAFAPMLHRDRELAAHGLLDYFPDCRISAADVGYLKPHPEIFQHALETLGTKPEETVFIGDNPVADVAGAQAAGMRAVLRVVANQRLPVSGLVIPDAAVNSLVELTAVLDLWYPGWEDA